MAESKALHKHESIPASYPGPLPKKAMLSQTALPLKKKKKKAVIKARFVMLVHQQVVLCSQFIVSEVRTIILF